MENNLKFPIATLAILAGLYLIDRLYDSKEISTDSYQEIRATKTELIKVRNKIINAPQFIKSENLKPAQIDIILEKIISISNSDNIITNSEHRELYSFIEHEKRVRLKEEKESILSELKTKAEDEKSN